MTKNKLTCPFCSGKNVFLAKSFFSYHIECPNCHAANHSQKTKKLAIKDWRDQSKKVQERMNQEHINIQLFL